MPERDGYIPGVPCWIDACQPDPDAAVEFYSGLFGWAFENVLPPEAGAQYCIGRIRGGDVAAVWSSSGGEPTVWNTYIWVADADETVAKVRAAGGGVVSEPMDVMDSGRMAVLTDPEGAAFSIWQAKEHRGAQVVNEHGSLNFNVLSTRDLERAKAFYGAVFGWQTLGLGAGTMWTLPGYGDHLEERSPGLREQMVQMGAPDGFIDVVASVQPIAGGDTQTPASWGVTFAVDDVDATVATAKELGASILAGPFDAPWTRMAVITDPQGATFVASQFVPENKDLEP